MSGPGGEDRSISERVYRVLLRAYPREFREMYGRQMIQVFRDLQREHERRGGVAGRMRFWIRTTKDLAATALIERRRTACLGSLVPLAILLGLLITLVDDSPGWDDTGVSAAMVFTCAGLLGALHPARPWLWALSVGLWIPVVGVAFHHNYEAMLALVVAFVGAYSGAVVSRALGTT